MTESKKCSNCGTMVDYDASFCGNCGKSCSEKEPNVINDTQIDDNIVKCTNCFTKNKADAVFCANCGKEIKHDTFKNNTVQDVKGRKNEIYESTLMDTRLIKQGIKEEKIEVHKSFGFSYIEVLNLINILAAIIISISVLVILPPGINVFISILSGVLYFLSTYSMTLLLRNLAIIAQTNTQLVKMLSEKKQEDKDE